MEERGYDVVVIGAGPVGENVADRARRGGLRACVVERRLAGGECSYFACVPSKAMLRPVAAASAASRLGDAVGPVAVHSDGVLARRDRWAGRDDSGQAEWLASAGIDLVRGHGRLAGERRVVVHADEGDITLRARQAVVLAVGSDPAIPPIPGLAGARPWTNREATTASRAPGRLAVLGGGPVACEMAQAYAGLGSDVTLLARGPRLLRHTEPFAADLVAAGLRGAGVDLRLRAELAGVTRDGAAGPVAVTLADQSVVEADEVLAALGRQPATSDVGLESVGLEPGRRVEVDDSLRAVGVPGGWLYAAGDANGRNPVTHMGKYQARICGDVIAARAAGLPSGAPGLAAWADRTAPTQVVFTDPQVGSVGLTEAAARERGLDVRAVDVDLAAVAGAGLHADGYAGQARVVVDEARRIVVGATFAGQDIADLLHSATIAVAGAVPLDRLWHAVPPFPTISEVWLRLLEAYGL